MREVVASVPLSGPIERPRYEAVEAPSEFAIGIRDGRRDLRDVDRDLVAEDEPQARLQGPLRQRVARVAQESTSLRLPVRPNRDSGLDGPANILVNHDRRYSRNSGIPDPLRRSSQHQVQAWGW